MNLLFSIDDSYVHQLMTTFYSIHVQHPGHCFNVYVLQNEPLKEEKLLSNFINHLGSEYYPVIIDDTMLTRMPEKRWWTKAIYYRLLAQEYLPTDMTRILYLDADILCINSFYDLYQEDLGEDLYGGASHSRITLNVTEPFNKLRLQNFEADRYINTGVLLMNLPAIRETVTMEAINDYIEDNHRLLMMPDQDIVNGLYGDRIYQLDDKVYNFDTRYSMIYHLLTEGEWDNNRIIAETVFLHFCGKDKPWQSGTGNRYTMLYKHYDHLKNKIIDSEVKAQHLV